ncbi:hypothetical protein G9C85_16995 [Halorubellus sp. JP-L1]|uniref:hypothetical protein n=1 Tax=Halorubellus sp. JP-L1 TaxID=2715753 RepID=UPI00140D72E9|nr:hypothetical protein [Halorubellus sp. JP-L1]NHN43317.1 hypothetical protein [Halorubellus sp. JP-L1]
MPRRRPRKTDRTGRRRLLAAAATSVAGIGLGLNVIQPSAYTSAVMNRQSSMNVAGDTDGALLGLLVADSVKKNNQELLVEITNNASRTLTMNVSLDDPNQGTLYGPNGPNSPVSLTIDPGVSKSVDIDSSEPDGTTVPFSIGRNGSKLSFDIGRQTTVQAGNTSGEVSIDKLNQFGVNQSADEWTIKTLEASSTNYDLDTVELEIIEQSSGTTVGTKTYDEIGGTQFTRKGSGNDPAVVVQPDDASYDVTNETYELTVTATDTAGNFAQRTETT